MSPQGPQSCIYKLTYRFVKSNDPSSTVKYPVTIDSDSVDTKQHKDTAYSQLTRMLGSGHIADVKRDWTVKSVGVEFANKPWSDWNDLETVITNLSGVQSIRYDPPKVSDYHPPRYIINVASGMANSVQAAVKQYYAGLKTQKVNGRKVVVVVSPLA